MTVEDEGTGRRLSIEEWKLLEGIKSEDQLMERLEDVNYEGTCPPLCDTCDPVEPDGICQHGHPSVLLALGLI